MNGRCCVFQPFDKGPFDKRYEDTISPAINASGLEPYRVDRDPGVVIPIETLHEEIRSATICLADISTQNPNVMYELGYAIASGKDVAKGQTAPVMASLKTLSTVYAAGPPAKRIDRPTQRTCRLR